jgi:hypothetical protein
MKSKDDYKLGGCMAEAVIVKVLSQDTTKNHWFGKTWTGTSWPHRDTLLSSNLLMLNANKIRSFFNKAFIKV